MTKEEQEQQVMELLATGLSPAEVGERVGLTAAKVGMIRKANTPDKGADGENNPEKKLVKKSKDVVEAEIVPSKEVHVMKAEEYMKYSKDNGRTAFGGKIGEKLDCSVEALRAYINSGWKPSMIMEKYQIDEKELEQLVWKLSKRELREKPIAFSVKHDVFRR